MNNFCADIVPSSKYFSARIWGKLNGFCPKTEHAQDESKGNFKLGDAQLCIIHNV